MIQPRKLQNILIAYITAATPMVAEGLALRGSDNTTAVELPMLVVHVGSIVDEFTNSGIYRCQVAFQLHTQGDDEDGQIAQERLEQLGEAIEEEGEVTAALAEEFVTTAIINKGLTLHHKENQLVHALRIDFLLSENPDE